MKETMKPMLATGYAVSKVKYPCMVEPKYDGIRCEICLIGNEVHLLSRTGKELNVPHLREWAEGHRDLLPLDGEIYNHKELTFQQICSAVKCISPLTEKLNYVVYDKPLSGYTNGMRRIILIREFKDIKTGPVYLTESRVAHSDEDIQRYHDEFVAMGYEGAIIRNMDGKYIEGRSNNLMKLKRFDTTEFEILLVHEAAGQDKGTALFELRVPDTPWTFHARPVGSKELRADYLRDKDQLIGKMCTVRHFGYTDGGKIPRFPVALGIRDYE
jgi:DNA ligase-1